MLYTKLSEQIKEKTKDMVSEIFETNRTDDNSDLLEYVTNVIAEVESKLNIELTEEEIHESYEYISSLLEKAKDKDGEDEDEDEDEDEEEEEDEEEDEEDEDEKGDSDDVNIEVHVDDDKAHGNEGKKTTTTRRRG